MTKTTLIASERYRKICDLLTATEIRFRTGAATVDEWNTVAREYMAATDALRQHSPAPLRPIVARPSGRRKTP